MNKRLIKRIKLIAIAFITTLALYAPNEVICLNQSMLNLVNNYNDISLFFKRFEFAFKNAFGFIPFCLFVVMIYFYGSVQNKEKSKRAQILSLVLSIILSLIVIVCQSFMLYYGLSLVINDGFQVFISIIKLIGFSALLYHLFVLLFLYLDRFTNHNNHESNNDSAHNDNSTTNTKTSLFSKFLSHPVLYTFLIMMFFFIPYIIFFFPSGLNMDSYWQINQFYGNKLWTSHHPIFSTLYYGLFMKLGLALGNANLGLFIPSVLQVIVSSLFVAYITNELYKIVKKPYVFFIPLAYFCLVPVWAMHFYTEVKDIPFSIGFMGLVYYLIKNVLDREHSLQKKDYVIFTLCIITMLLFRHNGMHTIILTVPFILLINGNTSGKILSSICVCSIIFVTILISLLAHAFNIPKGSVSEVLSLPLQQTAAYIYEYSDELTDEEKEVIGKIYEINKVKENYHYETVDDSKIYFKDASSDEVKDYLFIWFKMFFKHPKCYIFATINSTYGYFYPDKTEYKDGIALYEFGYIEGIDNGMFNVHRIDSFHDASDVLEQYAYATRTTPIGIIYSCGTYFFFLVIITAIFIYFKKYKELLPIIPLYTIVITTFLSPVNAYVRYVIPIMICVPFVIIYSLCILKNKEPKNST